MGDPPYEIGDDCDICWGEGKAWGDNPTPKYVLATFSGIQKGGGPVCEPLPDGVDGLAIALEQDPVHPCTWYGEQLSDKPPMRWMATYQLGLGSSALHCTVEGIFNVFTDSTLAPCQTAFTNQQVPPNCYFGGGGSVT